MRPPVMDADSAPFWKGCDEGRLMGQSCEGCGTFRWPPREYCPSCHSHSSRWSGLGGTGQIVGLVVVERAPMPGFDAPLPLPIVHVELDGTGGKMVLQANLRSDGKAAIGDRVRTEFTDAEGAQRLPVFVLQKS
ncbi:hypothetical protein GCM10007897_20820 [Sphingobium jiangsuense]|uniref:Uncharacterized protein n=1 Tax=Sphingobium jiangsuense TaxID=870476 RepID=A0A7W6BFZ0_9SPHN|nr:zinc ribbon domain-containing protein [Sphingobium jiangsuense]MBB3924396.1 hypothetical protein [Sphingobium jiangsuense]GLT00693.1 hypothetical protein GCM10007897_20820 [Sphingobium jiangsuense]